MNHKIFSGRDKFLNNYKKNTQQVNHVLSELKIYLNGTADDGCVTALAMEDRLLTLAKNLLEELKNNFVNKHEIVKKYIILAKAGMNCMNHADVIGTTKFINYLKTSSCEKISCCNRLNRG
jgi:hypothetical protein